MKKSKTKKKKEPFWKRRILSDTDILRRISTEQKHGFLDDGKKYNTKEKELLDQKYKLKRKGFLLAMEEVKQIITAKYTKIKQCNNRIKQFQEIRIPTLTRKEF